MSSREYFAELNHEPRLGRWLTGSVLLALAAGLWTIWQLPISSELRWLGGAGWVLATGGRGWQTCAGQARWRRLRIHADGAARIQTADGDWQLASIQTGSVVVGRLAWLVLASPDGRRRLALLQGDSRESEQWRRLQVIWRHMGSGP